MSKQILFHVVGALGAVTPNLSKQQDAIGVTDHKDRPLQKAALLGTAPLLRRVLEVMRRNLPSVKMKISNHEL